MAVALVEHLACSLAHGSGVKVWRCLLSRHRSMANILDYFLSGRTPPELAAAGVVYASLDGQSEYQLSCELDRIRRHA